MKGDDLRLRTRELSLRVIRLVSRLPRTREADILGRQLLRSATSIGANYHEASAASSTKQFIAMIEIAQREAVETSYWLDLLSQSGIVKSDLLDLLHQEVRDLAAILSASARTAKRRRSDHPNS